MGRRNTILVYPSAHILLNCTIHMTFKQKKRKVLKTGKLVNAKRKYLALIRPARLCTPRKEEQNLSEQFLQFFKIAFRKSFSCTVFIL